jgi:hypothetical protein
METVATAAGGAASIIVTVWYEPQQA